MTFIIEGGTLTFPYKSEQFDRDKIRQQYEEDKLYAEKLCLEVFNLDNPKLTKFSNCQLKNNWSLKTEYTKNTFPILDEENLNIILDLINSNIKNPLAIEVMAGRGWLSYWLKKLGLEILATTDDHSWKTFDFSKTIIEIEKLDCLEAVKKYPKANLIIMSWPYMDDNAHKVLKSLRKNQWLLYIGESYGCTADEKFFKYVEKYCKVIYGHGFNQFSGIHDEPWLIRKR